MTAPAGAHSFGCVQDLGRKPVPVRLAGRSQAGWTRAHDYQLGFIDREKIALGRYGCSDGRQGDGGQY
jgi:hypothetical protein